MVIELVKLKAEHMDGLMAQEHMNDLRPFFNPTLAAKLEAADHSYSVIAENGRVIACGGLSPYWNGRAEAWAVFDYKRAYKKEMLAITRAVRSVFASSPFRRIECSVESAFQDGHRWAKALGFKLLASDVEAYFPTGKSASLFAIVREA